MEFSRHRHYSVVAEVVEVVEADSEWLAPHGDEDRSERDGLVEALERNLDNSQLAVSAIIITCNTGPLVGHPGSEARMVGLIGDHLDPAVGQLHLVLPLGEVARGVLHVAVVVPSVVVVHLVAVLVIFLMVRLLLHNQRVAQTTK